jgi:hypothetical protein
MHDLISLNSFIFQEFRDLKLSVDSYLEEIVSKCLFRRRAVLTAESYEMAKRERNLHKNVIAKNMD